MFKFDTNNYEYNKNSTVGVYILHGFSSTTYEVKDLAKFLGKNGFHTVANNLPGHGTTVEECNRIKYHNWLDFVKQDLADLSTVSKKVFVIGNSMGGVLALYLASQFPLNGFIVGGTVLKFRDYFQTNILVPLFCNLIKTQNKNTFKPHKNIKFYGYQKYPLIALNEYRKMIKVVLLNMKKIKPPGLIIHSHSDKMSLRNNVDLIKKTIKNAVLDTFFINNAHHNMFDKNPDQKLIFNKILDFLKTHN